MAGKQRLTASLEDYLEAIFQIISEKQGVRPKDIATRLKVSNASVTGALKALTAKKLIDYSPYEVITLTPAGEKMARDIIARHEALKGFLTEILSVPATIADDTACKMEHVISARMAEHFRLFMDFKEHKSPTLKKGLQEFAQYCEEQETAANIQAAEDLPAELTRSDLDSVAEGVAEMSLDRLQVGQKAKVIRVTGTGEARKRLADMGLLPGAELEMVRIAPMGDPIEIRVRGFYLSLRKQEAKDVTVEPL